MKKNLQITNWFVGSWKLQPQTSLDLFLLEVLRQYEGFSPKIVDDWLIISTL